MGPKQPDAFIAVMGVTGAGKSSFIQAVTGDDTIVIGHGLESCTGDLKSYSFRLDDRVVHLVDTPGFNDTYKSETQVLEEIAIWLEDAYSDQIKLTGVIYLHNIQNVRMEGSALRNLKMFRKLCGEDPLKNVILATSFWGKVELEDGERREEELRSKPEFWGGMIAKGSKMVRFKDKESALEMITGLVPKPPVTLDIQHELVDQKKELIDTAAGQTVNEELLRLERKYAEETKKIREEMQEALRDKDKDLQAILAKEAEKNERQLERVRSQQEMLKARHREERRKMELELEARLRRMQEEQAEELADERSMLKEQIKAQNRAENRNMQNRFESRIHQLEAERQKDRHEFQEALQLRDISFEQAVSLVRENEAKLRDDERAKLENEIEVLSKKLGPKKKERKTGRILMKALSIILPITTMATLGVPVPFPGTQIYDFVSGMFGDS